MTTDKKYLILAITFIGFVALIVIFRERNELPTPLSRDQSISGTTEWIQTRQAMEGLLEKIRLNPEDDQSRLSLAWVYIQESRVTGNHSYYDQAAMQLVNELLAKDKNNYDAICAKGTLLLSQHHFEEALVEGKHATKLQPYSASAYGIVTDALIELGDYDGAIVAAERMNEIRPDLRSYARISYLREIFGDANGAIEVMHMAVQSGIPGTEQTEWVRTCLGRLYEISGQPDVAEKIYRQSLDHRPNFPQAYAGLARIAWANGDLQEAEKLYTKARSTGQVDAFAEELTSLYKTTMPAKVPVVANAAIASLSEGSGNEGNSGHGHYADKELALLYLQVYQYDLALQHALVEYQRRPQNIDANRTLAWVHFRRGEYQEANRFIKIAMRTGSKNPGLLLEAGLIVANSGDIQRGKELSMQSLALQPCRDAMLRADMNKVFGTIPTAFAMN